MAEVPFAETLWRTALDTELYGLGHPLVDVGFVEASNVDDVKLAQRLVEQISTGEPEECVECPGAARDEQARFGVTHFALAGLAADVQLRLEGADWHASVRWHRGDRLHLLAPSGGR